MAGVLLIRADAGPLSGTGHFMRMLALAEAWLESGGQAAWTGIAPANLVHRISRLGVSVLPFDAGDDAASTLSSARSVDARIVVADGYGFPLAYQRAIRHAGFKLLVVDDNAENESYDADWILNVNVHAAASLYPRRTPPCHLFLGPQYTLIRKDIRRAASAPRAHGNTAARLLVTMGGADPPDATGRIIEALRGSSFTTTVLVGPANQRLSAYLALATERTRVIANVEDMTSVIHDSDLAFAGAGGTVWELALLGVPSVVVTLADNQVPLATKLHALGAVEYVGDARVAGGASNWVERLSSLATDPSRRTKLVDTARSLVDGRGALRIVTALQEN